MWHFFFASFNAIFYIYFSILFRIFLISSTLNENIILPLYFFPIRCRCFWQFDWTYVPIIGGHFSWKYVTFWWIYIIIGRKHLRAQLWHTGRRTHIASEWCVSCGMGKMRFVSIFSNDNYDFDVVWRRILSVKNTFVHFVWKWNEKIHDTNIFMESSINSILKHTLRWKIEDICMKLTIERVLSPVFSLHVHYPSRNKWNGVQST